MAATKEIIIEGLESKTATVIQRQPGKIDEAVNEFLMDDDDDEEEDEDGEELDEDPNSDIHINDSNQQINDGEE